VRNAVVLVGLLVFQQAAFGIAVVINLAVQAGADARSALFRKL